MPHRRTKPSIVLGAVAVLAIAGPLAVYGAGLTGPSDVKVANATAPITIPTQIVETALDAAPDIVIPLQQLTGLPLPDLRLSDLKYLPLPDNFTIPSIQIPNIPGLTTPSVAGGPTAQSPIPPSASPLAPVVAGVAAPVGPNAVNPNAVNPDPSDPAQAMGAVVKEVKQDTPFSMVALTSSAESAVAQVRRQLDDGTWGPWLSTDETDAGPTTTTTGTLGTEPIYVGLTKAVQILLTKVTPVAAATPAPAPAPAAAPASASAESLGYVPAAKSTPLRQTEGASNITDPAATPADSAPAVDPAAPAVDPSVPVTDPAAGTPASNPAAATPVAATPADVNAVLITPGTSDSDGSMAGSPVDGTGPNVITRAQWGADESLRCSKPTIDDFIGGAAVHHTAGSNDYTKAESAGIVRAIYAYHAKTLGWCDIGYNALVDKYGQIFEGRSGGLDKAVEGAHAGGFNENTVGVALMGNYMKVAPTQESLDAIGKFLGWRLGIAGLDPKGETTMVSEGTKYTSYKKGQSVKLPVIFGHRDVGNTECPGDQAYADLDKIRDIAASNLAAKDGTVPADPSTADSSAAAPTPADTLAGDAGITAPDAAGVPSTDVSAAPGGGIPALVTQLLRLTDQNPVAKKWSDEGGDTGKLGAALSGLLPAKGGAETANFVNGSIYANTAGQAVAVLGEIFKQFQKLGGDKGELGLPVSDELPIPDGVQTDFENGSLIFNKITGVVTTIIKTYNDTYDAKIAEGATAAASAPAADPAAVPAPATDAPAPAAAPIEVPAPPTDSVPAPAG